MDIEIWAPPTVSPDSISDKLNEWMQQNPSKPPFTRFLQDHISSEWPVFWHLKIAHKIKLNIQERLAVPPKEVIDSDLDICSICYCTLDAGSERLECNHMFHTMCLHQWFRYQSTCPMCRAPSSR